MSNRYMEYVEALLNVFPDGKDIPRMEGGDIDVMVLQNWTIKHGMNLSVFQKIVEFCMAHPEYDKDLFFGGVVDYLDTGYSKTEGVEEIMRKRK